MRSSAANLFRMIESAGIPAPYARSLLPSWWDDVDDESAASLAELKMSLARNLGIDLLGLSSETPTVTFKLPHERKFKRNVRHDEAALTPAAAIGVAAARVAVAGCAHPYRPFPDAASLREFILGELHGKYVSLRGLIQACWIHGVPVVHIGTFPNGMPRMDGMVAVVSGRPAILISKKTQFSAWMAFILAHEIGHISLGHTHEGEILVDEHLGESSLTEREEDPEEVAADTFALRLLGGKDVFEDPLLEVSTPADQAIAAMAVQRSRAIDAGHVILRHAYEANDWQRAVAALGQLDQERRAMRDLREALERELDAGLLSSSAREYLDKVVGL